MSWPDDGVATFFLVCFLIGLLFTVGSFVLGLGHGDGGAVADHGGMDGALGHVDHGGVDHGGVPHDHGGGEAAPGSTKAGVPYVNTSTIMAFLTWFGGAGYILRVYYGAATMAAMAVAVAFGVIGGAIVMAFLTKVLYGSQRVLDQRDFYLPGTLARVTRPIRAYGTGEIVYTKGGTRQVAGARSVDDSPIEHGRDVVIMRYERGIAYVQDWNQLMRDDESEDVPAPAADPQRTS
jgi:membrane protein implicated in regulation of membrane protease activity